MDYKECGENESKLQKRFSVALSRDEYGELSQEILVFLAMQMGVDYIANQPQDALRKKLGDDLDHQVALCLANQCVDEIVGREDLPAALEPVVESMAGYPEGPEFTFEATVYLKPELELSSYEPVALALPDFAVSDDSVARNMQAIVEEKARLVKDEQASEADAGTRNVISLDTKKCGMQVRALTMAETVYRIGDGLLPPQIEERLPGMKPGDIKEFSFVVKSKNFLGLEVEETMDCVLHLIDIVKKDTPDVTDDWVKSSIPGAHDVEGFRTLVRESLAEKARVDYDRAKEEAAASALAQRLRDLDLPEVYYDYARAGLMQNISAALAKQGIAEEEFYAMQGVTGAQFMARMRMRAEEVLRQGLALDALARHENLEIGEDDIFCALRTIAPGSELETRRMLEMNGRVYQLREMALRAKARTHLLDNAVIQLAQSA